MAPPQIYREIRATIEHKNGSKIFTMSYAENFTDCELDLSQKDQIECSFDPYIGDNVRLYLLKAKDSPVYRIDPWEPLKVETGKVTYRTKSFGVVDEEIIFYIEENTPEMKVGDEVECQIIEGKYMVGRNKYEYRCESIKKVDAKKDTPQMDFIESLFKKQEANEIEHVDSDSEHDGNEQRMEFPAFQDAQPNEMFYDLPYGLVEVLSSKHAKTIKNRLNKMVPRVLNYKSYKTRFHALIHLEEVEMKISFDMYKCRQVWIEPEKRRFSVSCSKICELRPPIAVGDRIEVRKHRNPNRYYRGNVERVLEDRFVLKFKDDFVNDYISGEAYSAEFFYSRTIFQRKHAAIDYAKMKLPEEFLFPKVLVEASKVQVNAEVTSNGELLIDGRMVPWFTANLNDEQKQSVAGALRGDCRPIPYIIFGPPGTGKTSTIIEIILQVAQHVKNSRIVVATQSNHAANVVSSRLIAKNPDIASNLLRLVSNSVLDRKSLPKNLYKVSGSVLNIKINDGDSFEFDELHADIKRNMDLQCLKNYKVIIGTCVGLGILSGKEEFSENYFTHVLIDEAAQCNEAESLIPINFVNLKIGQVIMAGDPLQLPPITLSPHAKHFDLVKSMLERYLELYRNMDGIIPSGDSGFDSRLVTKLRRNYRALPSILNYYDRQFYGCQLIPTICGETSRENNELKDINKIFPKPDNGATKKPFGLCFVNVEGRNERKENKKSWENKEEATIIKSFVPKILERNIAQEDIGVITPYYAQVVALKKELKAFKKVRIGTVEEFQGEEKKVIIMSTVKTSGKDRALQFIFCPKRLNTAISRAREFAIVFGKSNLLGGDQNWSDLISYCKENESFYEGKDIVQML